jgi:hypothetical protein
MPTFWRNIKASIFGTTSTKIEISVLFFFATNAVRGLRFDQKTINRKINNFQRAEEVCKNSNKETEKQMRISVGWNSNWKRVHSLVRGQVLSIARYDRCSYPEALCL